jgi:hypothetical protein
VEVVVELLRGAFEALLGLAAVADLAHGL